MTKVQVLLRALGTPVQDVEEETFVLFAQELPSQNLGFIDSSATTLDLSIAGRDLTIHQSPGVLSSNRAGGTTGAVVWKITPLFAEWLTSATVANPLFTHGVLSPSSLVLELGSGISGIVGLSLAPYVARYVLTDQPYVAKLLEQNLAENAASAFSSSSSSSAAGLGGSRSAKAATSRSRAGGANPTPGPAPSGAGTGIGIQQARRRGSPAVSASRDRNGGGGGRGGFGNGPSQLKTKLQFTPLDWETDEVTPSITGLNDAKSFDVVLACDCIYNEALVDPFVTTCVDLCRLRAADGEAQEEDRGEPEPTVCVIAQQLRDPLVFEAWVARFSQSFHTWRVPDELLLPGLRASSGFVVHVGVLKGAVDVEGI